MSDYLKATVDCLDEFVVIIWHFLGSIVLVICDIISITCNINIFDNKKQISGSKSRQNIAGFQGFYRLKKHEESFILILCFLLVKMFLNRIWGMKVSTTLFHFSNMARRPGFIDFCRLLNTSLLNYMQDSAKFMISAFSFLLT